MKAKHIYCLALYRKCLLTPASDFNCYPASYLVNDFISSKSFSSFKYPAWLFSWQDPD